MVPGRTHTPHRHLALFFGFFYLAFFLDRRLFVKSPALEFFEQALFIDLAFQSFQRPIDLILENGDLQDRTLLFSWLRRLNFHWHFRNCGLQLEISLAFSKQFGISAFQSSLLFKVLIGITFFSFPAKTAKSSVPGAPVSKRLPFSGRFSRSRTPISGRRPAIPGKLSPGFSAVSFGPRSIASSSAIFPNALGRDFRRMEGMLGVYVHCAVDLFFNLPQIRTFPGIAK